MPFTRRTCLPIALLLTALATAGTAPILKVADLGVAYGQVRAVQSVSLEVGAGEFVAVIGSNGAGKSSTMKAADINAACTTCHNRGEHALWDGSTHDSRGVSCISCHSIHAPASEKGQLKGKDQIATCASCHRDKASKLDRSGHMPVREGKMQCTSCHNTHGSTNTKMLRVGDSVAELESAWRAWTATVARRLERP